MNKELIIKKCLNCNALIKVIKECDDCNIMCCGNPMVEMKSNSTDAAAEKHIPNFVWDNNDIIVTVNHVMDDDHYIEWVCLITDSEEKFVYFKPGDTINNRFNNVTNGKLYSYCNKHGLWCLEIKSP